MQDAENAKLDQNAKEEIEVVEPVKPNRHERRKRAKLARKEAAREKIKAKRQKANK